MSWNPEQYLKFAQPRLRPAIDLLAHVDLVEPGVVYDLGCGTGTITRMLAERWPQAEVTGVDSSPEMLAQAALEPGRVAWQRCSLADWRADRSADLIFSNAALHWLPAHEWLFPSLLQSLNPGGVLAVQMPRNFAAPSHTLIAETVQDGPWFNRLAHFLAPPPVASMRDYYALLAPLARHVDLWEVEYLQVLEGVDPVKEWTKGTWLKPYLDALAEPERTAFEADYARRLRSAYPPGSDGKTLFPFRRLFMVVQKA